MSDLMSVRLHLKGVRVLKVTVDTVDRLEVRVESAREWSRCPHCGFRCTKVWDRRAKRVRDLEVSGRRTTLVWRRRRFWCHNCKERHLEEHDLFRAGLTRRFAQRLVRDARRMSIRAASRHHGVGWHRIMGLVRAHSERVATSRRARPVRVLLVDETSIRRRHRYVTVVACGDTGKVLAMIDGRTKAALSRFFRDQGPGWCRKVEIVVSDGSRSYQAAIAQYLPDARHVLDRFHVARWFTEGLTLVRRELQRRPPGSAAPHVRAGPVQSPVHPPAAGGSSHRRAPEASGSPVRGSPPAPDRVGSSPGALPALRSRRPRRRQPGPGTVRRPLRHRADPRVPRSRGHHHRLGRRDLGLPPQQTSNQRTHRRDQQLAPGPTPSRSRVHQHRQFRSPRSSRNMTPTPTTRTGQIPRFREASTRDHPGL